MVKQVLIYGCGSIGLRHAEIATSLGCTAVCVSAQTSLRYTSFVDIKDISKEEEFDLAIIATPTVFHVTHLAQVEELSVKNILVEKPLFCSLDDFINHRAVLQGDNIYVAYNLRFHPAVRKLKQILCEKKVLAIQFHVGQYLPLWRPQHDYKQNYSAFKEQGGGVLRDLSHELDLACYLVGSWRRVAAVGGKSSTLDITSEDNVTILAEHEHCPQVTIHLDYLQNPVRRDIVAVLENESIHLDLIKGLLTYNSYEESFTSQRNATYELQLKCFLDEDISCACTFEQGREVVAYIDGIERAIKNKEWVWNVL